MNMFSSCRRRIGADIFLFATLLSLAAPLVAANKKAAPQKAAPAKKSKPAKTTRRPSDDEIRRAGDLASENADRTQSERMDPTVHASQAEDRVHAWMRAHHREDGDTAPTAPKKSVVAEKPATKPAVKTTAKPATKANGARKATADDFDAAAEAQSKAHEPQPTSKPRSSVSMPDVDGEAPAAESASTPSVATAETSKEKPAAVATAKTKSSKPVVAHRANEDDETADADDDDDIAPPAITTALLHDRRGHLIMPAPMKGTHEILVHQNVMADHDGLDRIQDDDDLARMRRLKLLLPLPSSAALHVDERLPSNRRYARPWTVHFLADIARAHNAHFHSVLQVNSAVRTVAFQRRLMRTNGNAAPPTGETASPHLTGQAIDLGKRGMSLSEIAWMRGYLLPLMQQGKIDVEEEFQQSCFHISVYRRYMPQTAPKRSIPAKRASGRLIAGAIH